ncbi:hypothetical protein ACFV4F_37565 [Kitasatospora sp. NPDC059722]|uniref:hypothetical protein n=1 Tax=Kitasatospora sp. NPDC059722 TaxID=3346925 RepID=UPI0036B24C4A
MGGLLATLSGKLAERWLSLLLLPGALFVSTVAAARMLGHGHALDLTLLVRQVKHWTTAMKVAGLPGLAVAMAALLLASVAAGLAAQALGSACEYVVLASRWETWPPPLRQLARRCVDRRRRRWERERAAYEREWDAAARRTALAALSDPPAGTADPVPVRRDALLDVAYQRFTRISEFEPQRPTWTGDRIHAVTVRLDRTYRLDLGVVWPSLWFTLPEAERTEINAAREALTRATTLAGWSLLYLLLTASWWPGLVIAGVTAATAWHRTRDAAATYAQLIEASTQLHARALARQLGICPEDEECLTPETGWDLTRFLQGRGQGTVSANTQVSTTSLP